MKNILIIGFLFASYLSFAQTRNLKTVNAPVENQTVEKRKAVVIGMSDYGASRSLNNTLNDANDMVDVLTRFGFEVTLLTNNELRNLETNLTAWYNTIERNDMAIFYYAGHGVEVGGSNYLIPINADLNSEADVQYEALSVNKVLHQQTPYKTGILTENFYFRPGKNDRPGEVAVVKPSVLSAATEKYYYYIDQNGNESQNRFNDRKAAESEMRNRMLYGRIYSNAGEAFIVEKTSESVKTVTEAKTNGEVWNPDGIEMVFVQGGTFMMGCTSEKGSDCSKNEKPAHQVTLSDFYIGKYEVTQAQWKAVMGTTVRQQCDKKDATLYIPGEGDNYPMCYVSWDEVQEFIRKLNAQTGKQYRLPTEAEWEFAARGGNSSKGYKYSGSNTVGDVAWYYGNAGDKILDDKTWSINNLVPNNNKTHPVGTKSSNELGIYDMSGNVWEWCSDWFGYYNSNAQTDPRGPSTGFPRVLRGGGWDSDAWGTRVSCRRYWDPDYSYYILGFRLACSSK